MSYVIQNFFFINKKIFLTPRINYLTWYINSPTYLTLYRISMYFFINHRYAYFWFFTKIHQLVKFFYPTFTFYKFTSHVSLSPTNNFFLSTIYWNLKIAENLTTGKHTSIFCALNAPQNHLVWYPIKINFTQVGKNFYDKVIFFYFQSNHNLWINFTKFFTQNPSYLLVIPTHSLNFFYNTLFFPIYNF